MTSRSASRPAAGTSFTTAYGVPQADDHVKGELLDVSTVFLSKRKGAIVLRLDGADVAPLVSGPALDVGSVSLSYATPEGVTESDELHVTMPLESLPAAGEALYPNPEIQRTLAITDEFLAMRRVCEEFHAGKTDAAAETARLDQAISMLKDANVKLKDASLDVEAAMLEQLKANLAGKGTSK